MRTVYTKEELEEAFAAKEKKIIVKGELAKTMAEKIAKKEKKRKGAKIAGLCIAAASALAIPFSFGASSVGIAAGLTLTAAGLTLTMTATELAIILGFSLAVYGVYKLSKVKIKAGPDGVEVEIDPKYDDKSQNPEQK